MRDRRVLVLGLAKSGAAVAKLLARQGATVTINERKNREQCTGIEELEALGIKVICGDHPLSLLDEPIDCIVKNPGIPYDIPFVQEAVKRGIPILTEVEIGYCLTKSPIIGVTGSNGKTTTTMLICEMLKESGIEAVTAGNIGTVFCEVAAHSHPHQWLVTELSSFQLLGTQTFRPKIGVLLNIYNAHLDYHGTKEAYTEAKAKLFKNQKAEDIAVLNADQEETRRMAEQLQGKVVWFSRQQRVDRGVYLDGDLIVYQNGDGERVEICSRQEIRLPGVHNLENSLAAVATALEAGATLEGVRKVLRVFRGVAHRLQFVRELDGVSYYNDSKATNALATKRALESFSRPVILIAGGLDRGEDFGELCSIFRSHLKALIIYGQTAPRLKAVGQKAGVKPIIHVDNVREAVKQARIIAQKGDTVLLSPAAASWDQFNSYEERGDMFIQCVHMLK
jgi:UDP-N-acetylmuramoylalanine--D-glutamate ligase